MLNYDDVIDLVKTVITNYEQGWNEANSPEYELEFNLTMSHHKVPDKETGKNKNVAYLRLDRTVRDEKGADIHSYTVYHDAHTFKNVGEITTTNWKKHMYTKLLVSLVAAGIEHAEMTNRLEELKTKMDEKEKAENVKAKSDIEVTAEMPAPLREDEKEYKDWVDKNHEGS